MSGKCPTCNVPVADAPVYLPFCSERCRLIDLGQWLEGSYSIAGNAVAFSGDLDGPELNGTKH